jgi:hypothetical protein
LSALVCKLTGRKSSKKNLDMVKKFV